MDMQNALEAAEKHARIRDGKNVVNLASVAQEEQKANEQGYGLYKLKDKNKALFVQAIQQNLDVLIRKEYLTNAELGFLFSLMPLVQLHSNGITDTETGQFMTVSDIAKYLKRDRTGISSMIQSLLEKGILLEIVDSQEIKEHKRSVTRRPIFMNPEIIYAGDRNRINATLSKLVIEFDKLERKKVLLMWKLWIKNGGEFGRLFTRKSYLEFKKKKG
ncbi:helix-turn-helix domain-containing protein [Sporosarcina sp. 179-K 3D1 HS]|uniref:hypothetical protein n=1 Tax=Sporosarcina sp. 179-K 3D1 HS TaxID=3232169 RepID=UPI0039A1EA28